MLSPAKGFDLTGADIHAETYYLLRIFRCEIFFISTIPVTYIPTHIAYELLRFKWIYLVYCLAAKLFRNRRQLIYLIFLRKIAQNAVVIPVKLL